MLAAQYGAYKVHHGMLHEASLLALTGAPDEADSAEARRGIFARLAGLTRAARALWGSASTMPDVRRLLFSRSLVELAVMMTHAIFADVTRVKLGWDAKATGLGMAFSGALSVLVDLAVLPALHSRRLLTRNTELRAALLGAVCVSAGLVALSFATQPPAFLRGLALLALGTSIFKSAMNTMTMGMARRDEAGGVSGAVDATEAVCRVAAPLIGGTLLEQADVDTAPRLGAGLAAAGALALYALAPAQLRKGWGERLGAEEEAAQLAEKKRQ